MYIDIHNPQRVECQTHDGTKSGGPFATIRFESRGSLLTMFFVDPDSMREHAEALRLLADSLEEKQS